MRKNTMHKIIRAIGLVSVLSVLTFLQATAQENTSVSGVVVDAKTKSPLEGATIQIEGSTNSVTTNAKGEFKLTTFKKLPFSVFVSFIGYTTQEVPLVSQGGGIRVELVEASSQLGDVVVVGYGTQRKKDVTGSVASVPKENFNRPATSFDNLLQGSVAGVTVSQSSSQPGSTSSIRIRGGNSLSFGNDPLYVIDGFIYYNNNDLTNLNPAAGTSVTGSSTNALSTINPGDIESIEILKDASATAIYGSRGANGVVIITTKRGVRGSNNIAYSGYYGTQSVAKQISVLNGPQWAKLFDDIYTATPTLSSLAANKHIIDSLGAAGVNGDWADAALRQGYVQNHQISIYGGDTRTRYSLSGDYFNQQGGVLNTDFTRYNARFNYERNVTDKFKVTTSIFGSNSVENKLTGNAYNGINFSNAYSGLYSFNPLATVKNPDGTYNTTYQPAYVPTTNIINGKNYSDNPINDIVNTTNQSNITRILGNFAADYKITKELTFRTTFGSDILSTKLNYYAPSYTAGGNTTGTITGYGSVGSINYLGWLNENTLTYDHTFSKNNFVNILAGYTTQYEKVQNVFAAASTFPSDATTYNNLYLGSANQVTGSAEGKRTYNSWLGRINYSYKHKYNVTLSGRADGASPAGIDHKWGFFPAIGLSWNVNQESFFDKYDKTISNLKVRLSAGSIGNANFPPYSSLSTIGANGYYFGSPLTATNGLSQSQLSNPDLTWETTTQYDAGIDAGFLDGRISFVGDIYYKKTSNLFVSAGGLVPLSTGYATVAENIGSVENKGLELTVTTENIKTKDFSWKTTLLYATNSNKVLSLGPSQSFQPVASTGQVSPVIVAVGLPVGTFWGYKTDGLLKTADVYGPNAVPKLLGVSQQTGDRKYLHAPGITGTNITTADKQNLGSAQPKFTASISNTLAYKGFDLTFFFQGSFGNKIFNLLEQQLEKTTTTTNVSTALLDRWDSVANPNGRFPKAVNAPVMQMQDTYIQNGSYVRLKNIVLGYTFPASIASKIWAKQIRIYVSAQNLLTITKYTGLDPEANFYDQNNLQPGIDFGTYPSYRTYQAGVDVTF